MISVWWVQGSHLRAAHKVRSVTVRALCTQATLLTLPGVLYTYLPPIVNDEEARLDAL